MKRYAHLLAFLELRDRLIPSTGVTMEERQVILEGAHTDLRSHLQPEGVLELVDRLMAPKEKTVARGETKPKADRKAA